MLRIKEYRFPESAEAAYTLLKNGGKQCTVIAGGAFLNLGSKPVGTAVDLSRAGLDTLEQHEGFVRIGAMVPLGALDRRPDLDSALRGFLRSACHDIVGIQLRNMATFGGTIHARYGFSDVLTALVTLDVTLEYHQAGEMPLAVFMEAGVPAPDILKGLRIERTVERWGYKALRRSTADFPLLTAAVSRCGGQWRAAVGARPRRAALAQGLMTALNNTRLDIDDTEKLGRLIVEELSFGSNSKASREYRQQTCGVLVSDALKEAGYDAD